jgi:hypothetical protein
MGQGPHSDYKCGSIQRLDPHTGEHTTLYTACNGNTLSAPNDLVFDGHGGFYFTDLGKRYARHRDHGGVYYARPEGSKIVELAFPAQFLAVCSRLKWSRHLTNSPLLALRAMAGSSAAYTIISARSNAVS